jgi:hypothetical protein
MGKSYDCFLLHRYESNVRKQSGEKVKENQVCEYPNDLGHAIHRPGFIYMVTVIMMELQDKPLKRPGCCPY